MLHSWCFTIQEERMELTVATKLGTEGNVVAIDGSIQKHLETKLEKLETRWGKPVTARAALEEVAVGYDCTLTITLHGTPELISHGHADTLVKAVDTAVERVTRQFEAEADKRTGRERQRKNGSEKPVIG
jgi:ribosome-associated translation inhibitor RaiA